MAIKIPRTIAYWMGNGMIKLFFFGCEKRKKEKRKMRSTNEMKTEAKAKIKGKENAATMITFACFSIAEFMAVTLVSFCRFLIGYYL